MCPHNRVFVTCSLCAIAVAAMPPTGAEHLVDHATVVALRGEDSHEPHTHSDKTRQTFYLLKNGSSATTNVAGVFEDDGFMVTYMNTLVAARAKQSSQAYFQPSGDEEYCPPVKNSTETV